MNRREHSEVSRTQVPAERTATYMMSSSALQYITVNRVLALIVHQGRKERLAAFRV